MKLLLTVVILKNGLGVFTHRTFIQENKNLIDELSHVQYTEHILYEYLGGIESILLIDNNEVFARYSDSCGWTDKNGDEIKDLTLSEAMLI